MDDHIVCNICSLKFRRRRLFKHIETNHVGTRFEGNLYYISCGNCKFRTSADKGGEMIEHCFNTTHLPTSISTNWNAYIQQETERLIDIISSGVEVLKGNESEEPRMCSTEATEEHKSSSDDSESSVTNSRASSFQENRETENDFLSRPKSDQEDMKAESVDWDLSYERNGRTLSHNRGRTETFPGLKDLKMPPKMKRSRSSVQDHLEMDKMMLNHGPDKTTSLPTIIDDEQSLTTPIQSEISLSEKLSPCKLCGKFLSIGGKSGNVRQSKLRHGMTHSGIHVFGCDKCPRTYVRQTLSHSRICQGNSRRLELSRDDIAALLDTLHQCYPDYNWTEKLWSADINGINFKSYFEKVPETVPQASPKIRFPLTCSKCPDGKFVCNLKETAIHHVVSHSNTRLFKCGNCGHTLAHIRSVFVHMRIGRKRGSGCTGSYENIQTEGDIRKLRQELSNCFPEVDWMAAMPPGTVYNQIQF